VKDLHFMEQYNERESCTII